jgi:hypothetical protein
MDTSGLPQAAKEATVNTYLEVESKTLDVDYNQVLKSLVNMYKVCDPYLWYYRATAMGPWRIWLCILELNTDLPYPSYFNFLFFHFTTSSRLRLFTHYHCI